jgi:hypothetical protein
MGRKTDLRWCDLKKGEPVEVLWRERGIKLPLFIFKRNFQLSKNRGSILSDGFVENDAYEVIEKGEKDTWNHSMSKTDFDWPK